MRVARLVSIGSILASLMLPTASRAAAPESDEPDRPSQNGEALEDTDPGGEDLVIEGATEAPEGRSFFEISARAGVWFATLDGDVVTPRGNVFGTRIDFDSDLAVDEPFLTGQGEVFVRLGWFGFRLDYFGSEEDVDTTLDLTLRFAGVTFNAGLPVETEIEIESFGGRFELTPSFFDMFELGVVAGVRYFRLEGTIRSRSSALNDALNGAPEASEELEVPIGYLGLIARVFIAEYLEIGGYIQGFSIDNFEYDNRDFDFEYFEAELTVAVNFGPVSILAGYRIISADITETESDPTVRERRNEYDVIFHGPILSLRLRF